MLYAQIKPNNNNNSHIYKNNNNYKNNIQIKSMIYIYPKYIRKFKTH